LLRFTDIRFKIYFANFLFDSLQIKTHNIQFTTFNLRQIMISEILFQVKLDENRVPEKIMWTAEDGGVKLEETKAILLSVWDTKSQETLRIDLWTKEMPVDEMKLFFHQTLVAMTDTYNRATGDEKMTDTMKDFCEYFAEKLELKQ
jgi:gliding motility-associated protein GldC